IRSEAEKELLRLAEATNIPVVTTLMARGAFPDSHQLHLGMPGMHGSVPAVTAFQKADLLIAIGARFDDRVTGRLRSEEHTSELQSRFDLVCRLLLEKKNKTKSRITGDSKKATSRSMRVQTASAVEIVDISSIVT